MQAAQRHTAAKSNWGKKASAPPRARSAKVNISVHTGAHFTNAKTFLLLYRCHHIYTHTNTHTECILAQLGQCASSTALSLKVLEPGSSTANIMLSSYSALHTVQVRGNVIQNLPEREQETVLKVGHAQSSLLFFFLLFFPPKLLQRSGAEFFHRLQAQNMAFCFAQHAMNDH